MALGELIRQRRQELGLTQDVLAVRIGISKPYLSNIETGRAKNPPVDSILMGLENELNFERGELLKLAHLARTPVDVRQEHEFLEAEVQKLRGVLKELMQAPRLEDGAVDIEALSTKLGRSSERLDENIQRMRSGSTIPIINKVAAGYPHNFTDLDYPPSVADEYIRCPDLHDPQAFAARVVGDSMEPEYHQDDVVVFSPNTQPRNGDDCFVRFDGDFSTTFKRFYQDSPTTIRLQPLNSKYPAHQYDGQRITGLWPAVFRFERLRR